LVGTALVASATSGVGRLTNDTITDRDPVIHNGTAFWIRGNDVVKWSGGSTITTVFSGTCCITDLSTRNGRAAWVVNATSDSVHFYNGSSVQTVRTGSTLFGARTDGTNVVWQEWTGSTYDIFRWNGSSIANVSNTAGFSHNPDVDGGRVTWRQETGPGTIQAWWWNGSGAGPIPAPGAIGGVNQPPDITGNWIAWVDDDAAFQNDVYLYSTSSNSTQKITNNATVEQRVRVNAAGDVAFSTNSGGLTLRRSNGSTVSLGSASGGFDIDGSSVVRASGEIFRYDLASGQTTQITNDNITDSKPSVSGGEIIWQANWTETATRSEVFVYTDTSRLPNRPPVAEAGGPYALYEGDSLTLNASGTTDPDDSLGSLTFRWDANGNGSFTDANDVTGQQPTLPWSDVLAKIYAGSFSSGSSRSVGLHAQDPDGAASTDTTSVVAYARPADGSTAVIPSLGGLVEDDAGTGASLYIPPGAINAPTIFDLAEVPEPPSFWESLIPDYDIGDGWWRLTDVFALGPSGLDFLIPAQ
jgi:hypothetical protein